MRISIDTKVTVHVGEYSRGGRSRGVVAVKIFKAWSNAVMTVYF